ncbi:hypothetical protein EDC01DRAFT_719442 [Geopyxis carbonaria]|nr:hypothetical protein EDC01DRAFT_719442 [Geopyxis carbonaria]
MTTSYVARISNVLGPVMDRARRWSQSSTSGETTHPPRIAAYDDNAVSEDLDSPLHTTTDEFPTLSETQFSETITVGESIPERHVMSPDSSSVLADPIGQSQGQGSAPTIAENRTSSSSSTPTSQLIPTPEGSSIMSNSSTPTTAMPLRSRTNPVKSAALPEDDGQRALRQKLTDITHSDLPERERARKMHFIMTEKWNASRASKADVDLDLPKSPLLLNIDTEDVDNPYKLLPGDSDTTYYTGPGSGGTSSELGCSHYRRNNRLQCSTCERWHTCRFCHDEKEDHTLVRQETKNMLCMPCGRPQPAQQDCRFCSARTARYYCDKCKLWDDDAQKSIYHCNDCGICRIGQGLGKDFFHCKKCGVCMSVQLENSHRCIERSTKCDCPICGEFMFTSTLTVVFMTCGHSIHHKCYYEHMKSSYRCPTCARTIINMESQFRALDAEIENQPLPQPYSDWRCLISCNDCSAKSNVPFHFLGLKCDNCSSYNTSQIRILRPDDGPAGGGNAHTFSNVSDPPLVRESTPLAALPVGSPPTGALGEHGAGSVSDEHAISAASRAIAAAEEAIEVALEFDHGDEDLLIDDGWVTESDSEDDDIDWSDDNEDDHNAGTSGTGDDDDDDDDELINLVGHL